MKKWLSSFLLFTSFVLADDVGQGWSVDIGGAYTWMSLTTPPTYSGNTGGALLKITYQKPWEFFGQARSVYNLGRLSSSQDHSHLREWYTEFVGGYCFTAIGEWSITPYVGLGLDFLKNSQLAYGTVPTTNFHYNLYYAIAGFDTHYTWDRWMVGLQADCLPSFKQYLEVGSLSEAAWVLRNRVGAEVRLPVAYRYFKNFWLELTPYYRYLPIGASSTLGEEHRNLNQWGVLLDFRFFI